MEEADVIHTPTLLVPPRGRQPLVVTVLDLSILLFPQHHGRWWRAVARLGLDRAVREADALIAISQHTANDLVRLTGVARERVHVIPLAADPRFAPVHDLTVPARYGIGAPYLLYLGTLEPRKNLTALLHAFARSNGGDTKLVLAGAKGWMFEEIFNTVTKLGIASRVVFPGFVEEADLPALLNGATAFVYPSEYEGFGLPVLEAMSCGAPVITTNVSSLPEVAGDAGLLVPPGDVEALYGALRRVLSEPTLREEMKHKGLERAAQFSWMRTAQETVDVYHHVVRQ
jgi:glycosyltransferase involved in cell wall biosynthesis